MTDDHDDDAPHAPATISEIAVPPVQLPAPRRVFIGVRLSTTSTAALVATVDGLARRARDARVDVRWTSPTTYHVTLKFLGWVQPEVLPAITDAMIAATRGTDKLTIRIAKLGGFPSLDDPRVLWAGVEAGPGRDALVALAGRLEARLVELGFPAETRPFTPHVTIARTETRGASALVIPVSEQMFSETRVDGITLIETETKSTGSVYTDIRKISFGPAEIRPVSAPERQSRSLHLDAPHDTDDGWPRGQGPNPEG